MGIVLNYLSQYNKNSLTDRTRGHAHAGRPNLHMVGQATAFVRCGAHAVRAAVAAHRLALHRHVRMLLETVAAELDATERRFGLRTDTKLDSNTKIIHIKYWTINYLLGLKILMNSTSVTFAFGAK